MTPMLRRPFCVWGASALGAAGVAAPSSSVIRVARVVLPGEPHRPSAPRAADLGEDLCHAVAQVDPGLRFAIAPRALKERDILQALSRHELDLHWDLVLTPRRREQVAFLDGPPLWRHRLQLVSAATDPEDLPDLAALRTGALRHRLVAVQESVAAEFLNGIPGLLWSALGGEELPDSMLVHGARWGLLPSHARPAQGRAPRHPNTRPPRWRWQPTVFRDVEVHGAVSLAVPATTRLRLVQALERLEQQGVLAALKARHARA